MDTATIEAALVKSKGRIARAAKELGCSRAYLHEQVKEGTDLGRRLAEIRNVGKNAVAVALATLEVDPDEVALRMLAHDDEGPYAATLAVIVEKLAEVTGLAKRDVAKELGERRHQKRLGELLPHQPSHGPSKVMPTAITHDQRTWLGTKPRGTVRALLLATTTWPTVKRGNENLYHTSYLLPKALLARVAKAAEAQDASSSAIIRAVIDAAMEAEAAAKASSAPSA